MKHIQSTLQLLTISAACLLAAPPVLAAPVALRGTGLGDGTSLADYIEAPEVYFELYDITAFEQAVRGTGLGRLTAHLLPIVQQGLDEADLPDEAAEVVHGTLLPVLGGELSWEEGIAVTVASGLESEVGMTSGDAVSVAAAIGSRLSFAMEKDFTAGGEGEGEHWAMAWSLRPGGDVAITDILLPHLAAKAGADIDAEQIHMERSAAGVFGAWKVDDGIVVVRPGLMAAVSDRGMANRLLGNASSGSAGGSGGRRAVVTQFQLKRSDSIATGDRAWLYVNGDLCAHECENGPEEQRAVMEALGIHRLGDFEAGIGAKHGQMVTRMRLEKRGSGGLISLVRGRAATWKNMRLLTADTLVVGGLPQSPSVAIGDITNLINAAATAAGDGGELADLGALIQANPVLASLSDRGAFTNETLLFVRPGAAGIPMVYLAAEATPALDHALSNLTEYEVSGGMLRVRTKQIDGQPAWMITTAESGKQWGLAVMRRDGAVIGSYSLLALQDYARQRGREYVEERQALIESVHTQLTTSMRPGSASNLAGFLHVRVEPLAEWVWPMALMGLSMSGVAGLEDLPDAVELAEQIGDTTLLLYDFDDRVEVWGRGLLGGLGIIF